MITIYEAAATQFDTNGLGVLSPISAEVYREKGVAYQAEVVQPKDDAGKWKLVAYDRILRIPVPEDQTPALRMEEQGTAATMREIWRVNTSSSRLRMRSRPSSSGRIIGAYRKGTQLVLVEKTSSSWYRMTAPDGRTGYMSASYLQFVRTETVTTATVGVTTEVAPKKMREQPFRIYKVTYNLTTFTMYARHIFFDLAKNPILDLRLTGVTGAEAIAAALNAAKIDHGFSVYSDVSDKTADIDLSGRTVTEAILGDGGILETFGGELMLDWYDIYYVPAVGADHGVTIRRGKNLTGLRAEDDVGGVVTRVYPVGQDAAGDDLFLPEEYVASARESEYAHPRGEILRVPDAYVKSGMTLAQAYQKMREASQAELDAGIDLPVSTRDVKIIDLMETVEYADLPAEQKIYMGDTLTEIDDVLGTTTKLRVTAYVYDPLGGRYLSLTLGGDAGSVFAPKISRRQLPDNVIIGSMIAPGAVEAPALSEDVGETINIDNNPTISSVVSQLEAAKTEIVSVQAEMQTAIQQSASEISTTVSQLRTIVESTNDELSERMETMESRVRHTINGLELSESGSDSVLRVKGGENAGVYIVVNGRVMAEFSEDRLKTERGEFTVGLGLGAYVWKPMGDGALALLVRG